MHSKKFLSGLWIIAICTFSTTAVFSQRLGDPQDPNNDHGGINRGGNPNNGIGGRTDTPIDGGLSLLLAAGIGYGVKKAHNRRKAKMAENIEK